MFTLNKNQFKIYTCNSISNNFQKIYDINWKCLYNINKNNIIDIEKAIIQNLNNNIEFILIWDNYKKYSKNYSLWIPIKINWINILLWDLDLSNIEYDLSEAYNYNIIFKKT